MSFVVKRRRKRTAVDPCLGYYAESSGLETNVQVHERDEFVTAARLQPRRDVTLKPISELAQTSPRNLPNVLKTGIRESEDVRQVTVNDFLNAGLQARQLYPPRTRSSTRTRNRQTVAANAKQQMAEAEAARNSMAGPGRIHREDSSDPWHFPETREGSSGVSLMFEPNAQEVEEEEEAEEELQASSTPVSNRQNICLRSRTVRRVVLSDSDSVDDDGSSTGSEFALPVPPKKRRVRKPRNKPFTKSLGTRLFEAAVSTDGDPLDSLVIPPTRLRAAREEPNPTAYKPLRFKPVRRDSPEEEQDAVLGRRATLVDPRKVTLFTGASFCTSSRQAIIRQDSEDMRRSYGRITNWKVDGYPAERSSSMPRKGYATGEAEQAKQQEAGSIHSGLSSNLTYPPLVFVPLTDENAARHDKSRKGKNGRCLSSKA
ncbi:hypothetical protein FA15DRAFT_673612 [Coprinopsis marcescibilis]|uniref:Uncharacterized protein n=1 Tax=Coprinopsis marcescibilis TaxID=230819 RepID=A0A5C3KWI6_COPMA|nr:hypothetical protein FA15DRAFT_673612 [Coprinopsis marcescibilis]